MNFNNHQSTNTYVTGIGRGSRGDFLNPNKTFIPGRGRGRDHFYGRGEFHGNFNNKSHNSNRSFNNNNFNNQKPFDRNLPANFDRRLDSSLREISNAAPKNNFRNAKHNKNMYNPNYQRQFNQKHTEKNNAFILQQSLSNNASTAGSSNANRNVSIPTVANAPLEVKEERSSFQNTNKDKGPFSFPIKPTGMPQSWNKAPKNNTPSPWNKTHRNDMPPQRNNTPMKQATPTDSAAREITAADRAARFSSTSKSELYTQMKQERIQERAQAIKDGLLPDPNVPRRLEDAIDFVGTCQTKCPEFEIVERNLQNSLDKLELDEYGNVDRDRVVKAYRRSAAGNDQPLPSDVRCPEALVSTLDYLIDEILSKNPLEKCHAFIRDRTRSIRQDFTLQNIRNEVAVEVHERIARFHILCLHEMRGLDESKFSEQQEIEQLRKVLLSLMEFYEDLREEDIETPNEAEFRAYYILTHIRDKDIGRQMMAQPMHIFDHSYVQRALKFHAFAQRSNEIMETSSRRNKPDNAFGSQNNYQALFNLITDPETPFLMACLLESHFPEIRKGALKAMNVSYMLRAGGVEAEHVQQALGYDTLKQCIQEALHYGMQVDMSQGQPTIIFGQKHPQTKTPIFLEPLSYPPQQKSMTLVEPKKEGKTFADIVNGPKSADIPDNIIPISGIPTTAAPLYDDQEDMAAVHHDSIHLTANDMEMNDAEVATQMEEDDNMHYNANIQDLSNEPAIYTSDASMQLSKKRGSESEASESFTKYAKGSEDLVAARKKKMEMLMEVKRKADEAEAMAAAERIKLEALMEQKKKEVREKEKIRLQEEAAERERLAAEKLAQEKLQQEAEERERARLAELAEMEAERLRLLELQRQKEEEIRRRREEAKKKIVAMIAKDCIKIAIREAIQKEAKKIVKLRTMLKKRTKPWMDKMRRKIAEEERKAGVLKSKQLFYNKIFSSNPYHSLTDVTPMDSEYSDENIAKRVKQCVVADKVIEECEDANSSPEAIWGTEDFGLNIYGRTWTKVDDFLRKHPNFNQKINWQLVISVEDTNLESSVWYQRKFGLDDDFLRKTINYAHHDVTMRMISPGMDPISRIVASEIGGLIFALPEANWKNSEEDTESYWSACAARLEAVVKQIEQHNPTARFPILICYFPVGEDAAATLQRIPLALGLERYHAITDYRFLIMKPDTIATRIVEEVNWVARSSQINQPV
ncbi:unnamed protein product [Rhizopus microsporus]